MKLLPLSLGGQLVVLMLGGFVVGNLFGALGLWSTSGALHPIAREHALSRTITAFRLAHREPINDNGWIDSFNNQVAHLWIDHVPNSWKMDKREDSLAEELRTRLAADAVTVRMPCRDDAPGRSLREGISNAGSDVECVEIDLALGDGRWLHTRQALPTQSLWRESWQLLRFSMLISIPPVLILMYVFVNRILRPTNALTSAAERMSRGERLDQVNIQGPEEIREIAVAFNDMHRRITRFVDERTRMLASISHDLRTPLTSLVLQATMLPESEERTEMLRTLEELRLMVNETLRFSNQDARAEASEDVDLPRLVREACGQFQDMGKDVSFDVPDKLAYRCRPVALKRALTNLIDNALRHGSSAEVTLRDRGNAGVHVAVKDDGPGIPNEMMDRVFEPFFQLDESRHRESGSSVGLGLSIARDCVRAHGGDLHLQNHMHGLVAVITLPPSRVVSDFA